MITTPHALIGLAIIKLWPSPWALPLAFFSHYLTDYCIPHWNPHIYSEFNRNQRISQQSFWVILVDGLIGVALTLFFMARKLPNWPLVILFGLASLMAVLPDAIEIPHYFFGFKSKFLERYATFCHQYQSNRVFFWGMVTQLIVVAACLKVILA